MAMLNEKMVLQGAFLFKWRSYLPFILAIPALAALPQSGYFEKWFGASAETVWDIFTVLVAFTGLGVRAATVGFVPAGTSGRNTYGQRADVLNTTGFYAIVRNPLYVGNMVMLLGLLMAVKVWWLILGGMAITLLYCERIVLTEEAFLRGKFGTVYEDWAARTPAFWLRPSLWRAPDAPFSLKTAIRREYHGLYLIVVTMTVLEALTDVFGEGDAPVGWLRTSAGWEIFFAVGTVIYVVTRLVRKKTQWLVASGR